ncbi:12875_t:CDS:2 [Ambispora leptoticha]|uniref:12875_t:CDS:1 n=1 Tax=Ambispora leptoticha TaxID=144679 RepID=A0A9N8WGT4_9GLOM|nr:12875_t:CDS:2 [Ambispora leptoticha]
MISFHEFFVLICSIIAGYFTYKWYLYPLYLSPLRKLPGPPIDVPLMGNLLRLHRAEYGAIQLQWTEKYGGLLKYYGFFNLPRILVSDPKLVQHILVNNVYEYPKPSSLVSYLLPILGNGLLVAEGDVHKRQRKLMTPVFAFANIKEMIPIFAKPLHTLKKLWIELLENNKDGKEIQIDIMSFMSKATLDVIGLIGFDYQLNALTGNDELTSAYKMAFGTENIPNMFFRILSNHFPIFRKLPIRSNRETQKASKIIDKVSMRLVKERKEAAIRGELKGNDLLTSLIKVNEQQQNEEAKMSDVELQQQIMTFLAAGHETTSVAVTWAIWLLSKNRDAQDTLRKEIIEHFPDTDFVPNFDTINSLEYLNCVVKETLRIIPPVPVALRVSSKNDTLNGYFIPKDTPVFIPIVAMHRLSSFWGPDAEEFVPSRWLDPKLAEKLSNFNYLPFLAGSRSCIGQKIALSEFKVFLAMLIRNFEFREIEGFNVKKELRITWRPKPNLKCWVSRVKE